MDGSKRKRKNETTAAIRLQSFVSLTQDVVLLLYRYITDWRCVSDRICVTVSVTVLVIQDVLLKIVYKKEHNAICK